MTDEAGGRDVVTIDADAAAIINSLLDDRGFDPQTAGMRISTEQGGCAGRLYRFNLTDDPHADDIICGTDTANVFVDATSLEHLDGAELSLADTAHGTGFRIENPNADQECGCGLSFR